MRGTLVDKSGEVLIVSQSIESVYEYESQMAPGKVFRKLMSHLHLLRTAMVRRSTLDLILPSYTYAAESESY
jgi:hypothetical protein